MGKIRAGLKFNVGKHGRVYVPVTGGSNGKKSSGKGCALGLLKWPLLLLLIIAIFAPKSKKDASEPSPEPTVAVRAIADPEETSAPEPSPEPEETSALELSPEPEETSAPEPTPVTHTYILNTGTRKFHTPGCSSVKDIKDANKQEYEGTREDLIAQGYEPCGRCHP